MFRDLAEPRGVLRAEDYYWFSRLMRPRLIRVFQRARLIGVERGAIAAINDLILEAFRRNNEVILRLVASLRIPVVLVTPVGNLQAEPYGEVDTMTSWYQRGMAVSGYEEALRYLKMAKDSEVLTYDLRAKSPLLEYLRERACPGVSVLDLDLDLAAAHFGFGFADFLTQQGLAGPGPDRR